MKTSAQHSDGSGLVFRGPFVYGRSASGTLTFGSAATNRWHFSGKEDQDVDFDLPYTDFGARLYSPGIGRWIAPDPASEKYYDISPYAYCANNPVNYVDPDGEKIYHILEDGSIEMLYYEDEERRDLLFNADNTAMLTVYNQSILSALFMKCPHHEYLNITFNEVIFPMESIQKRISQRR